MFFMGRKITLKYVWNHNRLYYEKNEKKKMKMSHFLTSGYITKLRSSGQYGTGSKTNTDQWNKTESPEINPCTLGTLFLTKEARIYNGAKTASSTNGAGKTGQLRVKE